MRASSGDVRIKLRRKAAHVFGLLVPRAPPPLTPLLVAKHGVIVCIGMDVYLYVYAYLYVYVHVYVYVWQHLWNTQGFGRHIIWGGDKVKCIMHAKRQ